MMILGIYVQYAYRRWFPDGGTPGSFWVIELDYLGLAHLLRSIQRA